MEYVIIYSWYIFYNLVEKEFGGSDNMCRLIRETSISFYADALDFLKSA